MRSTLPASELALSAANANPCSDLPGRPLSVGTEALMDEFARGHNAKPMTLIFASHNLGQVRRLASRVLYLEQGRLLADLPVNDFFNGPRLKEVSEAAHLFVKGEST